LHRAAPVAHDGRAIAGHRARLEEGIVQKHTLTVALLAGLAIPGVASAEHIQATLGGYNEVPSVSTPASGSFSAMISRDDDEIEYELTFSDIVGTVQQSHIHIAQAGVNGSVVIWLCQTATTPAPASVAAITPFCPQSGTVTGTITALNVITAGTASQQIVAGELQEVIDAIRAGVAYVNVHATPLNPGGEIRGQVKASSKP
jgi:CHRD domain-containing protein